MEGFQAEATHGNWILILARSDEHRWAGTRMIGEVLAMGSPAPLYAAYLAARIRSGN
jgi:hypothetical protein